MNFSKKLFRSLLVLSLLLTLFSGCNNNKPAETPPPAEKSVLEESSNPEETSIPTDNPPSLVHVGGLKGPTGLGMVNLMEQSALGETANQYNFTLEASPDLITGKLLNGELNIAAVPVNLASVLYNKSGGDIVFLGVNTLGVLHLVTNDPALDIQSIEDLRGKDIYTTGQGTTPEYSLRYILEKNGLDPDTDVNIIFESEAAALQTKLLAGEIAIAVLPEPFVSVVTAKNPDIKVALDLTKAWEEVSGGTVLTTGGVVANRKFVEDHPAEIKIFMEEYAASCALANSDIATTAALAVQYELLPNEAVATTAIPRSNITFISGEEMKTAVSSYLTTLLNANPQAVGGALPEDDFYYAS